MRFRFCSSEFWFSKRSADSKLFPWQFAFVVVSCCFLLIGIHASGILIPLSLLMLSEWSLLSCTFGSFLRSLYGPVPISTDILANLTSPRKRNIKFCHQFSFPMVIPSPLYRRLQKQETLPHAESL